ncbi:MAG TPA: type II secretion system secretin GspD [Tepidisphaeraceae bacterium]
MPSPTLAVRHALLAAACAAVLATGARAQTTPADPATTPPAATRPLTSQNGGLQLNFQDASIDVVLNELSAAAGFIVVKEVKPEGRVTLVSKQTVSPDEAVLLLNTVLRNAGYIAIQQERILKIVSFEVGKRLNIPVRTGSDPSKVANTDELITQVIPLRYANATQLKTDLQPLIGTSDFTSNQSSNALVITDTSANIRRVVQIIAALDTTLADAIDVEVFQLKYASAAGAAALINSVFGDLNAARPQAGGASPQQGGGNNQGGGGGPGGGFQRFLQQQQQQNQNQAKGGKVTAAADDRTNSLVVTGPTDVLRSVRTVVQQLDNNPASEETMFVYRLRNAQAVNVEGVLNSLFNGTQPQARSAVSNADRLRDARTANGSRSSLSSNSSLGGGSGRATGGGGGAAFGGGQARVGGAQQGGANVSAGARQAASDLAGQVTIIADIDTNALLVRTSPANYVRVKEVLDELDKPVAQVLIKVLIAEVTHDNGLDVGVQFSALNLRNATNESGTVVQRGQTGGSNFGISPNATGLVVQLLEENFTATVAALETAGKLDVLSRPYILASDNQLASITVGQEVPFITATQFTDTGNTNNTIEYSDIGILLDVIPHINSDGLVILDVAPEISTLTSSTIPINDNVSAPIINKRSAISRVGVNSGQTIVIGGLMEDRVTQRISQIPLLGDIPYLGELFKRRQTDKRKTELLIFLTPHVAATPEKLPGMAKEEVDGTQLLPRAVTPKTFNDAMEGLRRGDTQRLPTTSPVLMPDAPEPDPKFPPMDTRP